VAAALSGISTHVLDVSLGRPAVSVPVTLEQNIGGDWYKLATHLTDADGRVQQLLPPETTLSAGTYRLVFSTGTYFKAQNAEGLYPEVAITFLVHEHAGRYHIPLLLAANGYSTYRGS
jgi:5-hydroxyisourate hydrolase